MAVDAAEAARVLLLAREAGVPFAFLGNARALRGNGSLNDIDVLVAEENLGKVWTCLEERLGAEGEILFNTVVNEYSHQLYWRHPVSGRVLHVDLLPRLTYRGLPYLHIPLDDPSIDTSCGFPAVSDADLALYMILRQVLWTGSVAPRYALLVSDAVRRHSRLMLGKLRTAVGRRQTEYILEALAGGRTGPFTASRRRFLVRAFTRHPLSSIGNLVRHFAALAKRFIERPGIVVVLLGSDGSGKTSVITRLSESPRALMPVVRRHLFPGWLPLGGRRYPGGRPVVNPHGARPRTALTSVLKLAAWYAEFTLGWVIRLWRPLEQGAMVLFDRYAFDILVDPLRYRYGGPARLAGVFARAVPRPDLLITLDAPAQTLLRRKTEISVEELERQRAAYLAMARSLENGRIVDADQPLEDVVTAVEGIILDHLAARAKKRGAALRRTFSRTFSRTSSGRRPRRDR